MPVEEVITTFIAEEAQKNVKQLYENEKQDDLTKETILFFDNYMNQSLPHHLLKTENILVVRLTNFEHWKTNATDIELQRLSLVSTSNGKLIDFS